MLLCLLKRLFTSPPRAKMTLPSAGTVAGPGGPTGRRLQPGAPTNTHTSHTHNQRSLRIRLSPHPLKIADRLSILTMGQPPQRVDVDVSLNAAHAAVTEDELHDARMEAAEALVVQTLDDVGGGE